MKIAILNLMPNKETTERQLKSLLPQDAAFTLLKAESHKSKNAAPPRYTTLNRVKDEFFDLFIITGAPVEHLDFPQVDYWEELKEVFAFTRTNSKFNIFICWAAQAALWHFYKTGKQKLPQKRFGVFGQSYDKNSAFYKDFPPSFLMPHSRHTKINKNEVENNKDLRVEAWFGEELSVFSSKNGRDLYITGHPEYDADTLDAEYKRDIDAGKEIALPVNYYPADDIKKMPQNTWRKEAVLFYQNIIKHLNSLNNGDLK